MNPDAIFQGSNLWSEEVKQQRSQSYNIGADDLPDYYRQRNLLKEFIYSEDVGGSRAVPGLRQVLQDHRGDVPRGRRPEGRLPPIVMEQTELTWEAFMHQANAAGLDTSDTVHMEELFAYAKDAAESYTGVP